MKKIPLFILSTFFLMLSAQAQVSMNMNLIYNFHDTTLVGTQLYDNAYNEVWGYYDSLNKREYAIFGTVNGTYFVDLTDTSNIHIVDYEAGTSTAVVHRDYKNKGKYLYAVTDEGPRGSMQIFDMSSLPDSVTKLYESDTLFETVHNIWIDGDRMYGAGVWNRQRGYVGLEIFDISNPLEPSLIKSYVSGWPWNLVHDIYGKNDTMWLNSGTDGLYAVDFADPESPQILLAYTQYPFQGYNHSGWLSEDGKTYVFADETWGMPMKMLDVSDFGNPSILSFMNPETNQGTVNRNSIAHNQIIHNNLVYAAYYYDGLYIFDISNLSNPYIVAHYQTSTEPYGQSYKGNWGVYPFLPSGLILATDMQTGFFVLEYSPFGTAVSNPKEIGFSAYPNPADGWITIEAEQSLTAATFTLTDLNGRIIIEKNLQGVHRQTRMDLSGFAAGIYVLKVEAREGVAVQKLVVK